jgi:dihydroorotate dehydrogenase electron transfer subunit
MYRIETNEQIANDVYRLVLCADAIAASAEAGQFVNIYLPGGDMLLPRPFGIANAYEKYIEIIYTVVGKGTERLSGMKVGESLRVLGPNGNGFDLERAGRNVILVGGGLGIAPLRFVAKRLRERADVKVTALLGYSGAAFYADEIRSELSSNLIYTISRKDSRASEKLDSTENMKDLKNDLSSNSVYTISETDLRVSGELDITGNVMDLTAALVDSGKLDLRNAAVLACGPTPMLKAVSDWSRARGIPAQLSLEARMGCGYGACVGCSLKTRGVESTDIIQKKVCVDGPVFAADRMIWD